ncbi:molybdenum cofactor guanylyltransferase [Paenibacillus sp. 2TAF8]|jgi:molybdopterin-guanine dinucleotide biosynthesis protein A|uniref:molybdenum cofactor guanylyltransferase n=1 Tax=Paenibacillus sp. 2TAF8 TaxID=3233020 RepID=UPI003F957A46
MDAEKWTGIILAGGLSSRMGTNKALLKLNGSAVLTHMNNAIRPAVSRIVVAAGPSEAIYTALGDEDFECVKDAYPGKGPLAGLHAALTVSHTEWNLVSACDMPLLQTSFFNGMKRLAAQYPTCSVIVPRVEGRIHPLAGVYHRRVLPLLEQCLIHDRLRVIGWLEEIGCQFVETNELEQVGIGHAELQLSNMNTPEEFEKIRIRLQHSELSSEG